ncbi:hypothetical protein, partial [Xanthomonas hortorum]
MARGAAWLALDATATGIWLGFSDVTWTPDVLKKNTGKGRVTCAAWAFSTQPFYADGSDAAEMVKWATQAASPFRAALVVSASRKIDPAITRGLRHTSHQGDHHA